MIIEIYEDKMVIIGHAKTSTTCSAITGMIQSFRLSHPLSSELVEGGENGEQYVTLFKNEDTEPNYNMIKEYLVFLNEENKDYSIEYVK